MAATLSTVTALRRPLPPTPAVRHRVFISYARKDITWLKRFQDKLAPALSDSLNIWSDQDIAAGQNWHECIEQQLASASAALLLVSDRFLNSSYISSVELPKMLERHQNGGLKIYWVPLTDELYEWTELAPLQPVWPIDQPLKGLSPPKRDDAVKQICKTVVMDAHQLMIVPPPQRESPDGRDPGSASGTSRRRAGAADRRRGALDRL